MNNRRLKLFIALFFVAVFCRTVVADDDVGKVVALRGKATVQRDRSSLDATLKMGIQPRDTVRTGSSARVKLLFIDDSVLTLGDNSTLAVKEFIYAKGKEGKSIFNLMDGKMRSVVGKTKFEVQTPTAVASARGTVIFFDVGLLDNQFYSKIVCLEGTVWVKSIDPKIVGEATLTPGTMIIIKQGAPFPTPAKTPPSEEDNARNLTSGGAAVPDLLPLDDIKNPQIPAAPPVPLQEPLIPQHRTFPPQPPPCGSTC
jgi:FecR protein